VTVVVGTKGSNISRDYSTNVRIPSSESGLPLETIFLCFQLRSLDPKRFSKKPAGMILEKSMAKIENAVSYCLRI